MDCLVFDFPPRLHRIAFVLVILVATSAVLATFVLPKLTFRILVLDILPFRAGDVGVEGFLDVLSLSDEWDFLSFSV